jgi:HD superfamily phosphohydrolase
MTLPTRVWDPLYGRINLSKFEYKLISLPEVQRLRGIRMCNINSLLVTGASEISRFEHTIGVLRLTQEWLKHHPVSKTDSADLTAAALLHDMQTGPFGHSLQYVLEENEIDGEFIHEDIVHGKRNYYHQDLIANASFAGRPFGADILLGPKWTSVGNLIKGQGLLGPLISGSMDLDNIDNVVRLAYHVGVANSDDSKVALSLAREIDIIDGALTFSESVLNSVHRWLEIRRALYNLLLLDWAEFSAKAMFTRAVEIALAKNILGASSWVHTDAELLTILEKHGIGDAQAVGDLIKRLRLGDLYTPVVMVQSPSIQYYEELSNVTIKSEIEAAITEFAKRELNMNIKIIFHLILDKGKTQRAVSVRVKETGETKTIGKNSKNLLIGCFTSKNVLPERAAAKLSAHIVELLAGFGLKKISDIEDPMEETMSQAVPLEAQMKLI